MSPNPVSEAGGGTVLVVDDEPKNVLLLQDLLEARGMNLYFRCGTPYPHLVGETVAVAGDFRQSRQGVEVDLHVGDAAISEHNSPVRSAGLHADLGQAFRAGRSLQKSFVEAVHIRLQLLDRRILRSDLTNLATDRNRDPFGLQLPDSERELDSLLVIRALLLLERRLRKIDKRRCIYIDVVETRRDRLARELLDAVHFRYRIYGELL